MFKVFCCILLLPSKQLQDSWTPVQHYHQGGGLSSDFWVLAWNVCFLSTFINYDIQVFSANSDLLFCLFDATGTLFTCDNVRDVSKYTAYHSFRVAVDVEVILYTWTIPYLRAYRGNCVQRIHQQKFVPFPSISPILNYFC